MENKASGRGGGWVAGQALLLAAVALAPRRVPGLPEWPASLDGAATLGGVLLGALGGAVAVGGAVGLGNNLTPFPKPKEDSQLVQSGIYTLVRHPIYTGIITGALGWSLLRHSTPGLLLTLLLGVFFDRKASYEERWLERRYAGYAGYRARVKKLIPWIY